MSRHNSTGDPEDAPAREARQRARTVPMHASELPGAGAVSVPVDEPADDLEFEDGPTMVSGEVAVDDEDTGLEAMGLEALTAPGAEDAGAEDAGAEDAGAEDAGPAVARPEEAGPEGTPRETHADDAGLDGVQIGDLVAGRYRLVGVLGRGANGVVCDAHDVEAERPVALKVLHPQVASQPVAVKRLLREATIAAAIRHPSVVEVYEGGRDGDTVFLAMERLEGQRLAELIGEHGALPLDWVRDIFGPVLAGVAAAHDAGVIHRDLKPDNVLLCRTADDAGGVGAPKILDFGVSKLTRADPNSQLTRVGMVMGTPFYMAPEQLADTSSVSVRADVYSLGVMLYEALSGRLPYEGDSMLAIFTAASEGHILPLEELRADLPPALVEVVRGAMQIEALDRFEDVHAMRRAFLAAIDPALAWQDVALLGASRGGDDRPLQVEPTRAMAGGFVPGAPDPAPASAPSQSRTPAEPSLLTDPRVILYMAASAAAGGVFVALFALVLWLLVR